MSAFVDKLLAPNNFDRQLSFAKINDVHMLDGGGSQLPKTSVSRGGVVSTLRTNEPSSETRGPEYKLGFTRATL